MDKYKLFEEKLKNREKIVGPAISNMLSTIMVEKIADSLDFVLFDGEHGIYNNESLVECLQVARLKGVPSFIRVADTEYHLISRALYMGADGIMIPRTESLEQVEKAVKSMNFSPIGKVGCGGHGQYRKGETIDVYKRYLMLQIESPEGVKNLPAILDKYGEFISAIVIGPYDFSVMVGKPFDFNNPELLNYFQQVFDICKDHNISSGIFCDDIEKAEKYYKMGANILWASTDMNIFMAGFNALYGGLEKL